MYELAEVLWTLLKPLAGFTGLCIITYIAHYFTVGRERRKEFNDVALKIRSVLLKELDGIDPSAVGPNIIDIDLMRHRTGRLKRHGFDSAVRRYRKSKSAYRQDEWGQASYANPEAVTDAINELLKYTKPR